VRRSIATIARIGVVAAAYAVITANPALAQVSYGPLQLRLAEMLKPLVVWEPELIPAFVIGNFLGNLSSPFVGPWELVWMPFANLVGAWACWHVGRINAYAGAAVYAVITAAAVTTMLAVLLHASFIVIGPPILASELLIIVLGVPVMWPVHTALRRMLGDPRAQSARAR